MKMKSCLTGFLLLILFASVQIDAQQNSTNSVENIRAKAEKGDANAQCELGGIYEFGLRGVTQDSVVAIKYFRKAAEQNFASAQFELGTCYANGNCVVKDEVEAVKWFRKAAEQNFEMAQYNLGGCYFRGQGVAKDHLEAVNWYRKAADQGDAKAQYNLGVQYEAGDGVQQDYAEAVKWYRKAAEQGLATAQSNLGALYSDGNGTSQDYVEAIKWYQKAAEGGDPMGQFNLGAMYAAGHGVIKDDSMAVKWWRRSAEQGEAVAQYNLGAHYANGNGIPKNYIQAYKWISLASAQGYEVAKKWLPKVEIQMAPEQVAEAQRVASEFAPRKEAADLGPDNSGPSDSPKFTGTGFFITEDGYLITNYHVVKDAANVRLLTSAGLLDASVVKVDAANDLALLKAAGNFAPLPVAASRTVKLGGTVATVGFPDIGLQGFAPKLAKGEIASLAGAADDPRYFQISLPVQPGNSGGALVDARGNVVGIVAAKLDASAALAASGALPENVNYAVKSSLLLSFLESVPDVSAKLKEPNTKDEPFEEVVKSAQDAAVLVLVY
jgi:TPR repeat protein